jgi:hypothetical protein
MCVPYRPSRDPEADEILTRLRLEGIENLYHFTSVKNLPSISKQGALCSKELLESSDDWPCPDPGGNDLSHNLDRANDNWDKIGLNLTPHTPMAYRKKPEGHLCFFVISPLVAGWEGAVFTDTNAASNDHQRGEGLAGLALINFEMVRSLSPGNPEWKKLVQAEVLVPHKIPLEFISKVAFVSEASKIEGERLWGHANCPNFAVDKEIFTNSPQNLHHPCGFPFVSKVMLTDSLVDRSNVKGLTAHCPKFRRQDTNIITAIIRLETLTGTKGKVTWDSAREKEHEFDTSDTYIWWPSIPIQDLPNGSCSLRVSLDDILWATVDFEVVP